MILKWAIISNRTDNAFKRTSYRVVTHLTRSYIRSRNTLMSAFPSSSAFNWYTCASRTEISISKFNQLVSVGTLIMLWAFIAVSLISKGVSAWCTSLNYCLIFEWTEKALRAVKTLN
jgi:hypothetical protein